MTSIEIENFIHYLTTECDMFNVQEINGVWCGLVDYMTTRGLVVGIDRLGYERRYCYQTREEANQALATYTDTTEHPTGNWIKVKGRFKGTPIDALNPNWSKG